jgi:glycosyltransferase involved in cell wall biosynthesis
MLSKHLALKGHEVHVVTSKLSKSELFKEKIDGIHIHRYPSAGLIWNTNPATFVMHGLKKIDADVVHSHSYIFLTSNQTVFASKRLWHKPSLLHLHGGIETITPLNDVYTSFKFNLKRRIYDQTIGRWTVKAADAIASVSKKDCRSAKKLWNLDQKRIFWIPNAVNIEKFNKDEDAREKKLKVVFIGRLEPWKGVDIFIKATKIVKAKIKDVKIVIVGDGSLFNQLSKENPKIEFTGKINHDLIPEVLADTSVLVLPSYIEGLPTVCLEALAAEVPIVASNIGGIPEVVINDKTGYTCPVRNIKAFADKIVRLLSNSNLRKEMGINGRKLIKRYYTWDKVVRKVENVYQKIIP